MDRNGDKIRIKKHKLMSTSNTFQEAFTAQDNTQVCLVVKKDFPPLPPVKHQSTSR